MNTKINHLEALRSSRTRVSVKYLEFTRVVSTEPNIWVCFYEGEDEKYFRVRIEGIIRTGKFHSINCKGKTDLLYLHKLIENSEYAKSRTLLFIDRDFDRPICKRLRDKIYETPCYSIENLYASEASFTRILSAEFNITEFNEECKADFRMCIDLYRARLNDFINAVELLNAWVYAQKRKKNKIKSEGRLNLNSINFERLVSIDLDKISTKYNAQALNTIFQNSLPLTSRELYSAKRVIRGHNPLVFFRGKYQIEFIRTFVDKLKKDRTSEAPQYFSCHGKVKINISRINILSDFSQYADTPDCLLSYIRARMDQYL